MSSFQRKKQQINIPGSRCSLHNGQLLVSTGNPSMDSILGGGLPLGSILLIEEDKYVSYSKGLVKYFLAEGVTHKHALFLASLEDDPKQFIKKIPTPCIDKELNNVNTQATDDMRIAWRYNALPKVDSEQKDSYGNFFDLTKPIVDGSLVGIDITYFDGQQVEDQINVFHNKDYGKLLFSLKSNITATKDNLNANENMKNILRICINSLGSPLWYDDNFKQDICLFLTILKTLVRNSQSVCLLTMPTHLFKYYDENLIYRIHNLVDFSIELESFIGSDKETNPIFKEYHGLLYIRKIIALNSLAAYTPDTYDLAFKQRRKKFVIEKLHLPPELQEPENTDIVQSIGCGSASKHLLEF